MRLRHAQSGLRLQLGRNGVSGIAESGELPFVAEGMVNVVISVGQEILTPDGEHRLAPEKSGQLGKLRIVDLFHAQLILMRVEGAENPHQRRIGIGRLQAHLLGDVPLRVRHDIPGLVKRKARQIDAVGKKQRRRLEIGIGMFGGRVDTTEPAATGPTCGIEIGSRRTAGQAARFQRRIERGQALLEIG